MNSFDFTDSLGLGEDGALLPTFAVREPGSLSASTTDATPPRIATPKIRASQRKTVTPEVFGLYD
ncbi:hypothetical protein Aph01nite_58020 [Acrocarpospora phusangensis]|uniref:Uncharacterized protein n=1 Tax=Acrocarpospora phusangensis TaxID=1070424 RepID=A0A919QJT7_9ACTN|nr:hypothetical protein Aph01nite_58020 [Acrocarpospora phusangensis]